MYPRTQFHIDVFIQEKDTAALFKWPPTENNPNSRQHWNG